MAYGTKWNLDKPDECRLDAEHRAGPSVLGYLYRFSWARYATADEYGDYHSSYGVLELDAYPIHKRTPCGWTLTLWSGARRRFVSEQTTKRFALPTVELALESFIARKKREIGIYQARIRQAECGIDAATARSYPIPLVA